MVLIGNIIFVNHMHQYASLFLPYISSEYYKYHYHYYDDLVQFKKTRFFIDGSKRFGTLFGDKGYCRVNLNLTFFGKSSPSAN